MISAVELCPTTMHRTIRIHYKFTVTSVKGACTTYSRAIPFDLSSTLALLFSRVGFQSSSLLNLPMERGDLLATVQRVEQSRTRLKQLGRMHSQPTCNLRLPPTRVGDPIPSHLPGHLSHVSALSLPHTRSASSGCIVPIHSSMCFISSNPAHLLTLSADARTR